MGYQMLLSVCEGASNSIKGLESKWWDQMGRIAYGCCVGVTVTWRARDINRREPPTKTPDQNLMTARAQPWLLYGAMMRAPEGGGSQVFLRDHSQRELIDVANDENDLNRCGMTGARDPHGNQEVRHLTPCVKSGQRREYREP